MIEASEKQLKYFNSLKQGINTAYSLAQEAKKISIDPQDFVEIKLAENMAERVIGLISAVAPQIADSDAVERIQKYENEYGILDWRVAFKIAEDIATGKVCKFEDDHQAIEVGIRTGFAYVTVGVVSSPLEGLKDILIKDRLDGKGKYFCLNYSGPIRNAGGTSASVSVLIADYIRKKLGYAKYDPNEKEIKRTYAELQDYNSRVTNLQYTPSQEEVEFLMKNLPVEISGSPSEKFEVLNYKDLPRVPTNRIRAGFCLIHSSCIPLKAPKLWKNLQKWGHDMDMEQWDFLEEFLHIQHDIKAKSGSKKEKNKDADEKISPIYTYITDLVGGRPVLGHPLAKGGFRLRYGRSRVSGLASKSTHPATLGVLNNLIAIGTQLKIERPGKGASLTPCDTLEGPVVLLENGDVVKLTTFEQSQEVKNKIKKILFIGDMLINYGDFLSFAHPLIPPGYCEEWWIQEFEKAIVDSFGNLDLVKATDLLETEEDLEPIFKDALRNKPNLDLAIKITKQFKVPLHPKFTYHWKDLTSEEFRNLLKNLDTNIPISINYNKHFKTSLENLGIPHKVINDKIKLSETDSKILIETLNLKNINKFDLLNQYLDEDVLDFINKHSELILRDKSGVYIGARMGRPEKAKMRKLQGSPHVLFPVGEEGGRMKSLNAALDKSFVNVDTCLYDCKSCEKKTIYKKCPFCGEKTTRLYYCYTCGLMETPECQLHGKNRLYTKYKIDVRELFYDSLKKLKTKVYPDLIKGVYGTSNKDHISEHISKGILRAKHDIFVNKDGTIRYDASELPMTHFKPKEIGTDIEKLKELGYTHDIKGKPLENDEQICEMFVQDIVIPCCPESPNEPADEVFFRVTKFIDEELQVLYNQKPFYNLKSKKDLVGHLVIGLAPHTSAGTLGRIIGFSQTQGFFAHPLYHQAMRRDTDGDESCMFLMMDAFLNFSQKYLPTTTGSTMDAPLVLTSILKPSEVDDQVFDMDIVWKYPLDFYEACLAYKDPWEYSMKTIKPTLNTKEQYEGMGFTHDTTNFNKGVLCSGYKTLPSMGDKINCQMDLAVKLRSTNESDVAKLIIEKHFLKDTKGNLRKFSQQQFRCVNCNEKYRRPPLLGRCTTCHTGKIIFTIHEGSVIKYLDFSIKLAKDYKVPNYLVETLDILKTRVEGVFGKEKEIQKGLNTWFG